MKIIIDSNIIFSAMLSDENRFYKLFKFNKYKFYSINFLFVEIFKYKEKILKCTKLNNEDLLNQFSFVLSKIKFINEDIIPKNIFLDAYNICKDIDEKDTSFIALTLYLNGYLLTGDNELIDGLKKKEFDRIISINELL